jgi:hypothetical protein
MNLEISNAFSEFTVLISSNKLLDQINTKSQQLHQSNKSAKRVLGEKSLNNLPKRKMISIAPKVKKGPAEN